MPIYTLYIYSLNVSATQHVRRRIHTYIYTILYIYSLGYIPIYIIYIYSLNVSATQQLHKITMEQKNKMIDLEERLSRFEYY